MTSPTPEGQRVAGKKLCIVCNERPREVPDRNCMPGRPIKRVCRQCHGERLRGDLNRILELAAECDRLKNLYTQ